MKTKIAAAVSATALAVGAVALTAGPAEAATFGPGKITAYYKHSLQYEINLSNQAANVFVGYDTYFVNCQSASVSDGSLISMTNLGRVKAANKYIKIYTSYTYTTYIACQ